MLCKLPRRSFVVPLFLALELCAPKPLPPPHSHPVAESAQPLDTDPADIAVLNRVSWGAETADAQLLKREGLRTWLDRQLHPPADDGLPSDAANQIAAMEISQKNLVAINDEIRGM